MSRTQTLLDVVDKVGEGLGGQDRGLVRSRDSLDLESHFAVRDVALLHTLFGIAMSYDRPQRGGYRRRNRGEGYLRNVHSESTELWSQTTTMTVGENLSKHLKTS